VTYQSFYFFDRSHTEHLHNRFTFVRVDLYAFLGYHETREFSSLHPKSALLEAETHIISFIYINVIFKSSEWEFLPRVFITMSPIQISIFSPIYFANILSRGVQRVGYVGFYVTQTRSSH